MDSIIEVQRQTHEEIERFERVLYTLLSKHQPTHEDKVRSEHKASQILDRASSRISALNNLYEDDDARKAEVNALSTPAQQNDLSEFYSRLVKIQEHHSKYPDSVPGGFELELEALLEDGEPDGEEEYEGDDPISLLFSGEEVYGKYLDLYAHHTAYNNLKNIGKRPGYLQYLDLLLAIQSGPVHQDLSKEIRCSKDYESYIKNLHGYLLSFVKRSQPLVDVDSEQIEAQVDFERMWDAGEIAGWEDIGNKSQPNINDASGIWCPSCQKLYTKQTVYNAHLTSKRHLKSASKPAVLETQQTTPNDSHSGSTPILTKSSASSRSRASAQITHLTSSLLVSLASVLNETKSNVERKFSLTAREREQELLEQSKPSATPVNISGDGAAAEEEEDEERIYNPLKLPLGWDGKPIPYWLYKLHGLGVEYRCEICSDHVYMGRKNFDRHFQESRHAFGMRALGLPNTKHFHEITRIEDALSLAEKLKQEGRHEIFEQETMEEFEDDDGNVYNRKTYEDLKKQGLI